MKTSKLYVASLDSVNKIYFRSFNKIAVCKTNRLIIVRKNIFDKFYVRDLTTNKIYRTNLKPFADVGDKFVPKCKFISFNNFTENEEIKLPKSKVLKLFNEKINNIKKNDV